MCERCEVYRGTLEWIASHPMATAGGWIAAQQMKDKARDALVRGALVKQDPGDALVEAAVNWGRHDAEPDCCEKADVRLAEAVLAYLKERGDV